MTHLKPKAILSGNIKQTMADLELKGAWFHRTVLRGMDEDGPVMVMSVNNPSVLSDMELRAVDVHHSASEHPRLRECLTLAKARVR